MTLKKEIDISEWADELGIKVNDAKVIIRKLTYGQFTKMTEAMIQIKLVGKQQITNTSPERNQMLMLVYGIDKAPFELTESSISDLPSDLGQFLYEEIDELNTRGREKNLKD